MQPKYNMNSSKASSETWNPRPALGIRSGIQIWRTCVMNSQEEEFRLVSVQDNLWACIMTYENAVWLIIQGCITRNQKEQLRSRACCSIPRPQGPQVACILLQHDLDGPWWCSCPQHASCKALEVAAAPWPHGASVGQQYLNPFVLIASHTQHGGTH